MTRLAGAVLAFLLWLAALTPVVAAVPDHVCRDLESAVQVLGSGGPAPDVGRASSAYLLWLDGHSRVLIDAGGGTFVRFSESGASLEDLWLVALSHFHTDHAAEFPAFLKGGYFSDRTAGLKVAGPSGAGLFPGLNDFLEAMFDEENGAFRYLSGYISGDEAFQILPVEIPHRDELNHMAFASEALEVTATGVPHGIVPALSFRLKTPQISVVFAGDQNGNSEAFVEFARGADLLVMHMPIPEHAAGGARQLHAPPSLIGKIAEKAGAETLLLSHFMSRSIKELDASLALVRDNYSGRIIVAQDLLCVPVTGKPVDSARMENTPVSADGAG